MSENWELWLFVLIDDIQYGCVSSDWMIFYFVHSENSAKVKTTKNT